jgi:predicted Zn-dependent protease with MMP-like domain
MAKSENVMQKISRRKFEEIVNEGVNAIPDKFLQKLNNVAVVVESKPTRAQLRSLKIRPSWTLFGLYEGVPQSSRGNNYSSVLPDKITIFQEPIASAARDIADIREIVKNTVWHEIAHHFGMDERRVREAEIKRKTS